MMDTISGQKKCDKNSYSKQNKNMWPGAQVIFTIQSMHSGIKSSLVVNVR